MRNKNMNVMSKGLLALLLLPVSFAITSCSPSDSSKTYDSNKPMLPTNEYPEDSSTPVIDNTPEDTGELKDHIFDAEAAQFNGVSTASNSSLGGKCIAQSFFFDLSFSDSAIIRNVTNTNNKYIFEFDSDKAYKCKLEVAVASAYSGTAWTERNLSAMYDITINDNPVDADVVVPAATEDQVKGGNNYTCIQNVEVPLTIKEGHNLLVMSVLSGVCNLDYINIKTSANITGFTPNWWEDDTVVTIDLPTVSEAGTINLACTEHSKSNTFTLPALVEKSGYDVSEDKSEFSFTFNGEEYIMKADGTYSFPEETLVAEEPEPEEPDDEVQDPDAAPLPEVMINGKDFFEPSNWTKFAAGDDKGEQPVEMNSALKFKNPARFDFFYVKGKSKNVHLGDKGSTLNDQEVYNKSYSWTLNMSSKKAFDMILFGTANLPAAYSQSGAAGVYLTFEEDKISVKNSFYGAENSQVLFEAPVELKLDGETKYDVKITVNRVDANNLQFSLTIDDKAIEFTQKATPKLVSYKDGFINLKFTSSGAYGQRIAFVPQTNAIVRIYNLTLPENIGF